MRIEIEKTNIVHGNCKVHFSTEYGKAVAYWNGELPEEGKAYIVEIEIEEILVLGENLEICDEYQFRIGMEKETIYLTGYLESIEEDGYAILRLGESIISLEIKSPVPSGSFVKILLDKITLFDVKY
ncbi:hypothetical protein [Paenibacillus bovis]|uniref:Uncharacterized protein n=1 Tax=Paenibacillus bovis TaxID=1616788 RepID=A0A172ZHY0_9BACL|nr:hypothetical protein [Paenibacillus bovis]ANF97188.1 hypothetical protein AR543_15060 [Paenibacillus bovis]